MSNAPTTSAPTIPFPPRHRWLRRIGIAALVYLVAIIALRYWVVSVNETRLRAATAALQAAGHPTQIDALVGPPVAPEANAATLLIRAASQVNAGNFGILQPLPDEAAESAGTIDCLAAEPERIADNLRIVDALLRANQPALDDIVAGLELPQTDWGIRAARPAIMILIPHLTGQRQNARVLAIAAVRAHIRGDDATAVEHLHRMLMLAGHVEDGFPIMITALVATAIRGLAVRQVELMLPSLQVAAEGDPQPGRRAPRARVRALIAALANAPQQRARVERSIAGECVMELDTLDFTMEFGLYRAFSGVAPRGRQAAIEALRSWIARPGMLRVAAHCAERSSQFADGPELGAPTANPHAWWSKHQSLFGALLGVDFLIQPDGYRGTSGLKRGIANERMAAVGLAMRLYALDHGDWPEQLEELVPDYLPALPRDPFAAADQTFARIDTYGWPRLYSVAADGEDDGGWPCGVFAPGSTTMRADLAFSLIGRTFDCGPTKPPPHPDRPLWPTPASSPATSEQPE